jgi:hypothetical protein
MRWNRNYVITPEVENRLCWCPYCFSPTSCEAMRQSFQMNTSPADSVLVLLDLQNLHCTKLRNHWFKSFPLEVLTQIRLCTWLSKFIVWMLAFTAMLSQKRISQSHYVCVYGNSIRFSKQRILWLLMTNILFSRWKKYFFVLNLSLYIGCKAIALVYRLGQKSPYTQVIRTSDSI